MKKTTKIITHLPPRHLDDFLAVNLLKYQYPHAKVEFVHPQNVPEEYFNSDDIVLVDVGGKYDPEKRNYDHHQDSNIPSSLVLVIQDEFKFNKDELLDLKTIQTIDVIDRLGFKEAQNRNLITNNDTIDNMRKTILFLELDKIPRIVSDIVVDTFDRIRLKLIEDNLDSFISNLYKSLDELRLLEQPKARINQEKIEFDRKLAKSKNLKIGDLNVLISDESFSPNHRMLFDKGYDLLVERNSMNSKHTSIIINTQSNKAKDFDLNNLSLGDYQIVFKHPSGFLTVIDKKIDEVIQNLITKTK